MEWIQSLTTVGSVAVGVAVMLWRGGAFVNKVEMRFDALEKRMDKFEIRMDKFEIRMDKVEKRINDLSLDVAKIKERMK